MEKITNAIIVMIQADELKKDIKNQEEKVSRLYGLYKTMERRPETDSYVDRLYVEESNKRLAQQIGLTDAKYRLNMLRSKLEQLRYENWELEEYIV